MIARGRTTDRTVAGRVLSERGGRNRLLARGNSNAPRQAERDADLRSLSKTFQRWAKNARKAIGEQMVVTGGMSSVFDKLMHLIDDLAVSDEVVRILLPAGAPHDFEHQLWDYKLQSPSPSSVTSPETKTELRIAMGSILKDAVAFHNARGGYLLFGIADTRGGNRIVGSATDFDCGELNKQLFAATGVRIDCLFRNVELQVPEGTSVNLGLLLIPRRLPAVAPVRFVKDGPEKEPARGCIPRKFTSELAISAEQRRIPMKIGPSFTPTGCLQKRRLIRAAGQCSHPCLPATQIWSSLLAVKRRCLNFGDGSRMPEVRRV
jgi:hypothetical protein